MAYRAWTALFDAAGPAFFLLILERLLRLVVVALALFLLRGRSGLLLAFELVVVELPVPGERLRPDHEDGVDPAHIDLGLVVLGLVEPVDREGHGALRNAVDPLELPGDLPVLARSEEHTSELQS